MSDKKVERNVRSSDTERPVTPTQKMEASRSNEGTFAVSESAHDKGKSALLDRFREREERYRREQSLHAHEEEAAVPGGASPATSSPEPDVRPSADSASEQKTT